MRTFSTQEINTAVDHYTKNVEGFASDEWLADHRNVALVNNQGDVALFERQWRLPTIVAGHYFFNSRGRQAREVAKEFLKELFLGPYSVEVVTGLTPVEHLGALWMNRQLKFEEHGEIELSSGVYKFVMLTKQKWLQLEGIEE